MERVRLTDELELSRLVYGMWRLGDDSDTSAAYVRNKIAACLDQGITTLDQADIYGGYMAEEILGQALTPELRSQVEIVTKCDIVAPVGRYQDRRVKYYDTSREHILASVDHSLRLMGIDHIDLLLIHRPDPFMDHHETGAALAAVIASGTSCTDSLRLVAVTMTSSRLWEKTGVLTAEARTAADTAMAIPLLPASAAVIRGEFKELRVMVSPFDSVAMS